MASRSKRPPIYDVYPELKEFALKLVKLGVRPYLIASVMNINPSTIYQWISLDKRGVSLAAPKTRDRVRLDSDYIVRRRNIIRGMHSLLE